MKIKIKMRERWLNVGEDARQCDRMPDRKNCV